MIQLFFALILVIFILFIPKLIPKTTTKLVKDEEGQKVKQDVDFPWLNQSV